MDVFSASKNGTSGVQKYFSVTFDALVELLICFSRLIEGYMMRDDKGRFRASCYDQVTQIAIVFLPKQYHHFNDVTEQSSILTLTLHWPVPTVRPFSNSFPNGNVM